MRGFLNLWAQAPAWAQESLSWIGPPAVLAVAAFLFPRHARAVAAHCDRALAYLARRHPAAAALPVVMAGAIVLLADGFPLPQVHDEFSYLLAADTFAHGRVANPTPPLWQHFETFHVSMLPTYVSMYQPGSGLVLAAGTLLFGHPWFAIWLTAITLAVAVRWAAAAWLPPRWSLAAGLVAAIVVSSGYWLDSYWGGALPATGGALVLGSWPRMVRRPSLKLGLAIAAGAVILLYTRPYEGGVLCLAVGVAIVLALAAGVRYRNLSRRAGPAASATGPNSMRTALLAAVGVLALGAGWLGWYNWRTTGSPLLLPYVLNFSTYHHRRLFVFGSDRESPPVYRHEAFRRLYSDFFYSRDAWRAWRRNLNFYGASLPALMILAIPWLVRYRPSRALLAVAAAVIGAAMLTVYSFPHYLAPATAAFAVLSLNALRLAGTVSWNGRRPGRLAAYSVLLAWIGVSSARGAARLIRDATPPAWVRQRQEIAQTLTASGGRHLILVHYGRDHDANREWVYNGADLGPRTPVIWARAMDEDSDRRLRGAFADRTAWLLEAEPKPQLRRLR
jgi:hypothetical protein